MKTTRATRLRIGMLTELSLWHGANRAVGPGGMRYLASLPEPAAPMPAHMTVLVE